MRSKTHEAKPPRRQRGRGDRKGQKFPKKPHIKPVENRDWLTTVEAGEVAEVDRQTIQNWVTLGIAIALPSGAAGRVSLTAYKIGGRFRIPKAELTRFLEQLRVPSVSTVPRETNAEFARRAEEDVRLAQEALAE